jgi:hypothetical protein
MKGIYLTEESKKELEYKIAELEKNKYAKLRIDLQVYKEILSSAIILPVEEGWQKVKHFYAGDSIKSCKEYPNGLIIQPEN